MRKTRIETLIKLFDIVKDTGYNSFFLNYTNEFDLYDELKKMDEKEGIYVTENDLFLSIKSDGELNIKVDIEQRELIDIIVQNLNIDHRWNDNELVIQTYKGEIKELLNQVIFEVYELKKISKKNMLETLEGSIKSEIKNITLSFIQATDEHTIFLVTKRKKNKDIVLDSFLVNDFTELLLYDMVIQRKYGVPSYITGICQVNNLDYQEFRNIRNNLLLYGLKEKNNLFFN